MGTKRHTRQAMLDGETAAHDPHVWTSPPLVKRIAQNIRDALAGLDPAHRQDYARNCAVFVAELDRLDHDIRALLKNLPNRKFMVFHPAWGYFADTYGLTQVSIEHEGKEPGARTLTALIEQAKHEQLKVIFVQPQVNKRLAAQLARAIGGRVVAIDPLSAGVRNQLAPSRAGNCRIEPTVKSLQAAVKLQDVSFSYGSTPVLEHLELQVNSGEFLGIVGPNAGGKSTLLKLILGLLVPQSGDIQVLGKTPSEARRELGYVPQYPSFSREFPITVEQVVLLGRMGVRSQRRWLGALSPGGYTQADRLATLEALTEVEADDLAKRQIGSLSGGQLQRVLLARALVGEPSILILDEPTANIDQRLESDIFDLLKQLNTRMTILVVSHDVGFISSFVSRVACINRTLVCHHTDAIDGQVIQDLYGENVRMVAHRH